MIVVDVTPDKLEIRATSCKSERGETLVLFDINQVKPHSADPPPVQGLVPVEVLAAAVAGAAALAGERAVAERDALKADIKRLTVVGSVEIKEVSGA